MNEPACSNNLTKLTDLFFDDLDQFGQPTQVAPESIPEIYQRLLVHEEHMTVAVEAHHESLVDVEVLEVQVTETHYARKILLRRRDTGAVVQWGILRIHLGSLSDDVRAEIIEQQRPLGRILVRANMLRTIHLDAIWKINAGAELCQHFGLETPLDLYGRTADIHLNGEPAVEVLEIVAPE